MHIQLQEYSNPSLFLLLLLLLLLLSHTQGTPSLPPNSETKKSYRGSAGGSMPGFLAYLSKMDDFLVVPIGLDPPPLFSEENIADFWGHTIYTPQKWASAAQHPT